MSKNPLLWPALAFLAGIWLAEVVPFVEAMNMRDGKATIYVCENYVCRLPTNDLTVAARLLDARPTTQRP